MRLNKLELFTKFRGLQPGFTVRFTRPENSPNKINPFCLVGLNGSGKSNLMQVLAEIFYYFEQCAISYHSGLNNSFGFRIEYSLPVTPRNFITGIDNSNSLSTLTWRHVRVEKHANQLPQFYFWYGDNEEINGTAEYIGKLLPNQVIGYSSGMNEQISLPFLKMDFYYLELMRNKMKENDKASQEDDGSVGSPVYQRHEMSVNRLHFLDYHSNAMMVLANYLSNENIHELSIINDIVGIDNLVSFRIAINFSIREETGILELIKKIADGQMQNNKMDDLYFRLIKKVQIPPEINNTINTLIECSTTLNIIHENELFTREGVDNRLRLEMYFKVDEEMKRAFSDKIRGGPMQLFQQFYLLNLLNMDTSSKEISEEIRESDMMNTNAKSAFTKVADKDKVFHVDQIKFKKNSGAIIHYAQLSDGEHQYMQIAGALKLMNENATLFLMDEPETHLNPEWRSTLFSTLNNILKTRMKNDPDAFIPEQEIIVTSHSPFIVSDCQPEQVYMFKRDPQTGKVMEPVNPSFNTYGASVNFLTSKVFGKTETIAGLAKSQLARLKDEVNTGVKTKEQAMEESNLLGDSVEKILFIAELFES